MSAVTFSAGPGRATTQRVESRDGLHAILNRLAVGQFALIAEGAQERVYYRTGVEQVTYVDVQQGQDEAMAEGSQRLRNCRRSLNLETGIFHGKSMGVKVLTLVAGKENPSAAAVYSGLYPLFAQAAEAGRVVINILRS
ncbi:MAG: hypothetical protein ACKVOH_00265 [Chlamydiales bacterium]